MGEHLGCDTADRPAHAPFAQRSCAFSPRNGGAPAGYAAAERETADRQGVETPGSARDPDGRAPVQLNCLDPAEDHIEHHIDSLCCFAPPYALDGTLDRRPQ